MKRYTKPRQTQSEVHIFRVEKLSHEGRGIAHYELDQHPTDKHGKKVFIQFALPNETVEVKVTSQNKRLEEGDATKVIGEPSPLRQTPICTYFGTCGGCSLQHMHVDEQIRFKQDVLKSHLEHFALITDVEWLQPIRSLKKDYRCRTRIGVRFIPKTQQFYMGFRERQTNHLVNVSSCPILDQNLSDALPELKQCLKQLHGKADIGHIELSMGTQNIALLIRNTASLVDVDLTALKAFAREKNWQLYLQSNKGVLKRLDDENAPSELTYTLKQYSITFAFSPLDFTQVNTTVNEQMVKLACDLLDLKQGERVLDLFSGLGNFSLPMAHHVGAHGQVIGVEGSATMVQRGAENAKRNDLPQVQFFAQDLTQDFSDQIWAKQGFDAILIDPPRAGAEAVMHYLPHFNATRIVYVSCSPATLARDAGILAQQGYELKKAGVMDMFTHTGHVESIALFERVQHLNYDNE